MEHPVKVEYFRPDEGMKIYHMGRNVIYKIARDGNAFYKVNRATFIDKAAFEKELKKYLVKWLKYVILPRPPSTADGKI